MSHAKFSALANQVTQRRLDHLHKYHPVDRGKVALEEAPFSAPPSQLEMFDGPVDLEVFHQYDAENREVEWAFYTKDGQFLLQFAFSLLDRSYQVYSVNSGLFQGQGEMKRWLEGINHRLRGHYPPLELISHPSRGPIVQIRAENPGPVG